MEVNVEIRSGILTQTQLEGEVSTIIDVFQAQHCDNLLVSYGWECDLDPDELYQEKPMPLSSLRDFIRQSTNDGIFELGNADLLISSRDRSVEFVLCHEADIHMTASRELTNEIGKNWKAKGYSYYEVDRHEWIPTSPTGEFWMEM